MNKIIYYLKDQWLAVIITVILIFFTLTGQQDNNVLLQKNKVLEDQILVLKEKDHKSTKIIDSLSMIDTVIVNRIKIIRVFNQIQFPIILLHVGLRFQNFSCNILESV